MEKGEGAALTKVLKGYVKAVEQGIGNEEGVLGKLRCPSNHKEAREGCGMSLSNK